MIKIKSVTPLADFVLHTGLFNHVQLDDSRTRVYWNDYIDLPSDTIYEYGKSRIGA